VGGEVCWCTSVRVVKRGDEYEFQTRIHRVPRSQKAHIIQGNVCVCVCNIYIYIHKYYTTYVHVHYTHTLQRYIDGSEGGKVERVKPITIQILYAYVYIFVDALSDLSAVQRRLVLYAGTGLLLLFNKRIL